MGKQSGDLKFQRVQFEPSRSLFRWSAFWEKALKRCLQSTTVIKLDSDPGLWSQEWQRKECTKQKESK